ncbi:MAG: 50S ribosomal protein L11 methyltransferase [Meiothermus sp.]|uniref:50S ribosomal protein L11 methyltransferase n=1 Tax=Meiothermus sp. TaxID=1955249 RepID=UPI0025CFF513|nr:50S ribosomal protein L11 methyltransferase [Meiothermus sp.]MCS7057963.1 50S ribosomal protein L11 methyltransferase [Meiothermus sp.]MCS7193689.1 50S ribosomal protein L11 methyltransferase [Meiothermus sp.]MCX7740076.1 50S ribosomal protein L11 methyltransferase [Meiothermus sp.]MDW8091327.1 50S ribosomal protein L11 methyltransferase [Meiothermus sp.]MDW8481621.1 50S ribosomal protein L11 methyltransferase [Meiothermus sp.]
MHVFRLRGDFESLDPYTPLLFELGARGLEEKPGEVWAYFPSRVELSLPGEWMELPDTDWLEAYRRDLKPVRAGSFVVLAPWHRWEGPERRLVIEPGMAFGTGHHETTRMALEALSRRVEPGMRVLDLGTGSGILAIAAAMLGAEAWGVDIDPAVIPQARANAERNRVEVRFAEGSLADVEGPFDLVLANLYAELHAHLAEDYRKAFGMCGLLVATGILVEREGMVREALEACSFRLLEREQEGEWVCLTWAAV